MLRKLVFALIALSFILAVPAAAGERVPVKRDIEKKFDANKDGFLEGDELARFRKIEPMWMKMEELRKRSEEEKNAGNLEEAKNLWNHAEELKSEIMAMLEGGGKDARPHEKDARPPEKHEGPRPEGGDDEINALVEKAERLEAEGRHDDAGQIRARLKELLKQKIEEAEGRIREARERAMEAKKNGDEEASRRWSEVADKLQMEFKERLGRLQEKFAKRDEHPGEPPRGGERDGMKEKIRGMLAEADELERNGHPDEAAELKKQAERMMQEMKGEGGPRDEKYGPKGGDKEIADVKGRIEKLRAKAAEMKEQGNHDKAQAFMKEAEELERALNRELENRKAAGEAEKIHTRAEELRRMLEEARRGGREDEVRKLEEELHNAELEIGKIKAAARISELEEQSRELRERAARLKEKGAVDEMNAVLQKAEALERELAELRGGKGEGRGEKYGIDNDIRQMKEEIMKLRTELERLRAENERLRKGGEEHPEKPPRW